MPCLDLSGVELHYELIEGDARRGWLVFLHEGLGSVELWREFPEMVAGSTGRPALVYSRRGHGWSEPLDSSRPPGFMHDEALSVLPALLDRLSIEEPVLVGHSDGASIALIYAGVADRPVSGLVALAPHVFVEPQSLEGLAAAGEAFTTSDLEERMAKYHHDPRRTFYGWHDIWMSPEFRDWNIEDVLVGIEAPLLLIQGADDEYGSAAQIDAITAGVKGRVEVVWLEDCGHSPHLDQRERVTEATVGFIRRLPGNFDSHD
ncbi:MAG TPA: alpha/beta hydrolase [Acidimicrobiia bacterium]|nr:alpha/beta hydrolase [Acidimicrobiia bacterium]